MAKESTVAAISDETKEMLEEHVKKGKPRKFFLICKGVTINTLEVFKKGPFGPKIMKAKKDGFKGEVTYGIVTGQGKELYFQLAGNQAVAEIMKVDSFCEKPPTKRAKLREFLADNDLSFKCSYYILTDPALAPDPDSEAGASGAPPASCKVTDDGDSSDSETSESESAETVAPPVSGTNLFTDRLKALKPDIDRVVASGEPLGQEVKLRVSEAAVFARKKEFDQANGLLDQVEKLLKQDIPKAPPMPPADLSGAFNKRLGEIVASVKEAVGTPYGDQAKLKVSEAGVLARKKDFDAANALLDEAEIILADRAGTEDYGERTNASPVKFAQTRLAWDAAKKEVSGQLERLSAAILDEFDDEEGEFGAEKVHWVLDRFDEGLTDALDDIYNADPSKKPALAQKALDIVARYIDYVQSDELISHIEINPYENLSIRTSLLEALTTVQDELKLIK